MRKTVLLCAFCGLCLGTAAAQDVLVYDNNSMDQVGVTATLSVFPGAMTVFDEGSFVTQMSAQTWDIILVDNPANFINAAAETAIVNHINGGGAAIIDYWNMDGSPNLAAAFDAQVVSDYFTPLAVYDWGHTIWTGVASPLNPVPPEAWNDDGDRLRAIDGAAEVAGLTASPTDGEATVIIGNGGRTIINGMMFDNFTEFGSPIDVFRLVENELRFVPEPASLSLLGLAGLLALRRR